MADIQITLTIPDAFVSRVGGALNSAQVNEVRLSVDNLDGNGCSECIFVLNLAGLTQLEKVKSVMKKLLKAFVYQAELRVERLRWQSECNAVAKPTVDVPDDIIT